MTEPARGAVTVVRAQVAPRRRGSQIGATLVLAAVVAWMFISVNVILAGLMAVAALLTYPFMRRAAKRVAQRQPDWIEVRADRVAAVWAAGHSSELVRTEGSVLQVRQTGAEPRLYLVGAAGDDGSIGLGRFDVEQIGTAAMAHGWRWIPPDSAALLGPETGVGAPVMDVAGPVAGTSVGAGPGEVLIRLREGGGTRYQVSSQTILMVIMPFVIVIVALAIMGVPGTVVTLSVIGLGVALGVGMVLTALVKMRRGAASVIVGPHRLAVKYGSLSAHVVERSAIGSASVGSRWARMRSPEGRQLMWVPLKPKRDEVLAALQRYGWPVSEAPAGFRRH